MEKIKLKVISYLVMLPAILIGILAMISYGVSSSIWIQNIIIWIIGSILGIIFFTKTKQEQFSRSPIIIIVLLLASFLSNGLDGIHRWIQFGPLSIYVASIFLPLLLIFFLKLLENKHYLYVIGLNFVVLVILLFQPDAGQVTAFACATIILLWHKMNNNLLNLCNLTITTTIVIMSWILLDDLTAVPYVEHILFLVKDMGVLWFIFGIMSLLLLLSPFFFYGKRIAISLTLGVYFLVMMLVTFFGNFPMPIMGYGISPIIGYIISISYLNKIHDTSS